MPFYTFYDKTMIMNTCQVISLILGFNPWLLWNSREFIVLYLFKKSSCVLASSLEEERRRGLQCVVSWLQTVVSDPKPLSSEHSFRNSRALLVETKESTPIHLLVNVFDWASATRAPVLCLSSLSTQDVCFLIPQAYWLETVMCEGYSEAKQFTVYWTYKKALQFSYCWWD